MTKNLIKIEDFEFSLSNRTSDVDRSDYNQGGIGHLFFDDANLLGNILIENPGNNELFISRNTKISKKDTTFSKIIKTIDNCKFLNYKRNTSAFQNSIYNFKSFPDLYNQPNSIFSNKLLTNGKSINKISTFGLPYDTTDIVNYNTYHHKNSNSDYSHLFCLDKIISKNIGLLNIIQNPNNQNEKYILFNEQSTNTSNSYVKWNSGSNVNSHGDNSLILYKGNNLNIDASNQLNVKVIPIESNHYFVAGNTHYINTNIATATNPEAIVTASGITSSFKQSRKITYTGTTLNKQFTLDSGTAGSKILFELSSSATGSFFVSYNGVILCDTITSASINKIVLLEFVDSGWYNITSLYKDASINPVNEINTLIHSNLSYITTDFTNKKMIFIKHDMPGNMSLASQNIILSPTYTSEISDSSLWNNNFNTPVNLYFTNNLFDDVKIPYQIALAGNEDSMRSQKYGNSNILQQRIGDGLLGYGRTDSRLGINYMGYLGKDNIGQHYYLNISNSAIKTDNNSKIKEYYSTNILRDFNRSLNFKSIYPANPTTSIVTRTIATTADNYTMTISGSSITQYDITNSGSTGLMWIAIAQPFALADVGKIIRINITKTVGTHTSFGLMFNQNLNIRFDNFVMSMTTAGYDFYNTSGDNKQIYPYQHVTADTIQNYHGVLLGLGTYSFELIVTGVNQADIYNMNNLCESVHLNYNALQVYDNPNTINTTTVLTSTNQLASVWKNYTYALANANFIYYPPLSPKIGDRFKISHIAGTGSFKVQYRNITNVAQTFDLTPIINSASAQKSYVFEWRGSRWREVTDTNDIPGNNLVNDDFRILRNWTNPATGNSMSYFTVPSKVEVNQSNADLYHFYAPTYSMPTSVRDFMQTAAYFSPVIYNWNKSNYETSQFEILDCNMIYPAGTDWFTYGCLHNEIYGSKDTLSATSFTLSNTPYFHDNGQLYKYMNHNFITKIGNRYFLNHCIFYGTNRNASLLIDNSSTLTTTQKSMCRRILSYEIDTTNWRNLTYQSYYEFDETQIAFLSLDEDNFTKILVNLQNSLEILIGKINSATNKFGWALKQKETGNFVQIALDNAKNIWACTCDFDLDTSFIDTVTDTSFNNWTKPITFTLYKVLDNSERMKKYRIVITSLLNYQYIYDGTELLDTLSVDIYDEENEKVDNINYALYLAEGIEGITFENNLRYIDNAIYSGITATHTLKINTPCAVKLIAKILVEQ